MKFSNGFYLFQTESCIDLDIKLEEITFHCTFSKRIDGFDCYSFSYYKTSQHHIDFDEATIWLDNEKNLLIVFTQNEILLDYLELFLSIEFNISCKPLNIGIHTFLMHDGKAVITSTYKNTNTNKITTSIMKNDMERLTVIKKLLVGDYFEGIFERTVN